MIKIEESQEQIRIVSTTTGLVARHSGELIIVIDPATAPILYMWSDTGQAWAAVTND